MFDRPVTADAMTSPARSPNPSATPTAFTPLADGGPEAPREASTEVREALHRDHSDMQREVLLWQRWMRYLALIVVVAAATLLGRDVVDQGTVVPLLAVAFAYSATVFVTGWVVQQAPTLTARPWLPGLLVTADLAMVGAVVYLTGIPQVSQRFLIVALLFVPLAAFYFGVWLAVYAAMLSAVIYLLIGEILPPFVAGARPVSSPINVTLFTLVSEIGRAHV